MMPAPTIISRKQWDARTPKSITPLVHSAQRGTALHYTGSLAEIKTDHTLCHAIIRGIQDYHMDTKGWADIAYSFLGCIHGGVFVGRGRGVRTAANGTTFGNDAYHAVCFLGGDKDGRADVTEEGKVALRYAIESCNSWAGVSRVAPHSTFKPTACPGDELRAWIIGGMPVVSEHDMTVDELDAYLASDRGKARILNAVRDHVDDLYRLAARGELNGVIDPASTHYADSVRGTREAILNELAP